MIDLLHNAIMFKSLRRETVDLSVDLFDKNCHSFVMASMIAPSAIYT